MDQTGNQLDALGRITRAIKCFRQQSPVSQMNSEQAKSDYLKAQLSAQDWLFWEELQARSSEPEPLTASQPSLTDSEIAYQQFYHLLGQAVWL